MHRSCLPPLVLLALAAPNFAQGEVKVPGLQSLTVSGEYRLRFEEVYNYDLNEKLSDDRDFLTQRVRLNFDAKVNDDLSAFIQIQDVRNWGEEMTPTGGIGTTDASADGLDLHRAYLKVDRTPMGGTATIGRQVLSFGDERLVGGLEWLSQGRAFDGYRHTWTPSASRDVDVFVTNIKERMPSGVYDDAWFGGIYGSLEPTDDSELDVYLLFLNDEETIAGGNENRATVGLRYQQTIKGVEFGVELAAQGGKVNGADIEFADTHAGHAHVRWEAQTPAAPWVRLEGNYATGNDPMTAGNERFKNLFPTAHKHWGMMDFALWENLIHGMVQVGIKPCERSRVAASWHIFESVEETDVFAGPVGRARPQVRAAGDSNKIGNEVDIFYHVAFDTKPARSFFQAGYGIFLPGAGAKVVAGDDNPAHFFYLMTGLTF